MYVRPLTRRFIGLNDRTAGVLDAGLVRKIFIDVTVFGKRAREVITKKQYQHLCSVVGVAEKFSDYHVKQISASSCSR